MPNTRVPIPAEARRAMGKRLRRARWDTNLSMRELADRVGVTQNSVAHWEHGGLPGVRLRLTLAKFYKTTERELFAEFFDAMDRAERAS